MAGFYGVVFVQSLYFQQQRGATALETGLLFLPMTALVALLNPLVARFVVRYGNIAPIVGGQAGMALGLAGLCFLPADTPTLVVALLMVPYRSGRLLYRASDHRARAGSRPGGTSRNGQ